MTDISITGGKVTTNQRVALGGGTEITTVQNVELDEVGHNVVADRVTFDATRGPSRAMSRRRR